MKPNTSEGVQTIMLRPYKLTELAKLYSVNYRTLKKWLSPFKKDIGERQGHYYTISQVKTIFEKLSPPSRIELE